LIDGLDALPLALPALLWLLAAAVLPLIVGCRLTRQRPRNDDGGSAADVGAKGVC